MAVSDWTPTVAEVAAHIRARTKIAGGDEAGTFNEQTRPDGAQAEAMINTAARSTLNRLGGVEPCSEELREDAKAVVALRAALSIEASYYPEQVRTDRSNFAQLKSLHDDDVKVLAETVKRVCGTSPGDGEDDGAAGQSPAHGFDDEPILGRVTPRNW